MTINAPLNGDNGLTATRKMVLLQLNHENRSRSISRSLVCVLLWVLCLFFSLSLTNSNRVIEGVRARLRLEVAPTN